MRFSLCAVYVISSAVYMLAIADEETVARHNIEEARKFLALHNQARSEASVQPLTWNNELAARVQGLVNACTWNADFSSPQSLMYQGRSRIDTTPETAMEATVRERANVISGQTDACCSNSETSCCRYAKVVSSEFKSVGCGQKVCDFAVARFVFRNVYIAICFYNYT